MADELFSVQHGSDRDGADFEAFWPWTRLAQYQPKSRIQRNGMAYYAQLAHLVYDEMENEKIWLTESDMCKWIDKEQIEFEEYEAQEAENDLHRKKEADDKAQALRVQTESNERERVWFKKLCSEDASVKQMKIEQANERMRKEEQMQNLRREIAKMKDNLYTLEHEEMEAEEKNVIEKIEKVRDDKRKAREQNRKKVLKEKREAIESIRMARSQEEKSKRKMKIGNKIFTDVRKYNAALHARMKNGDIQPDADSDEDES